MSTVARAAAPTEQKRMTRGAILKRLLAREARRRLPASYREFAP
jgi:DNA-binding TFAR19-related protein (PDSD5 family)